MLRSFCCSCERQNCFVHVVVPKSRLKQVLDCLRSSGFENGPSPSSEFCLVEGDLLQLSFHGNIRCLDPPNPTLFVFNCNLDTRIRFRVAEVNQFLQKNFDSFRGFVQLWKVNNFAGQNRMRSETGSRRFRYMSLIDNIGKTSSTQPLTKHYISIPKVCLAPQSGSLMYDMYFRRCRRPIDVLESSHIHWMHVGLLSRISGILVVWYCRGALLYSTRWTVCVVCYL